MKLLRWIIVAVLVLVLLILVTRSVLRPPGQAVSQAGGRTVLEFDIHQDKDLIVITPFSEPPQLAIWLEEPVSHKLQTVFVTYRSATGDMVGKAECPACLPRWFEIYEQETGTVGLPTQDSPAPEAVTGATPQEENFKIRYEVKPGSRWICWLEMNLAGDFNEKYQEYDPEAKTVDWDYDGQPSLIYRAEITATPGKEFVPQLYGQANLEGQIVRPVSDDVITARDVFKSIKIRVVRPEPSSAE